MKCKTNEHDFILYGDEDIEFGENCVLSPIICQNCSLKAYEKYVGFTIVDKNGVDL